MIILTAANKDKAKDDSGKVFENFSFKDVIQETIKKAEECGYDHIVYDLGSLGIGKYFQVNDESFVSKGYYQKEVRKGYKSKSLFKPEIVKNCMKEYNDLIVYLDGDAQLVDNIDEIEGDDYDIGVTLRDPLEFQNDWYKEHIDIVRYVNAGVIFFNPTPATIQFINIWQQTTEDVGNDQMALNQLVCPDYYPENYSVVTIDGVRIKYFPCKLYNYYYFEDKLGFNIKIMHFKGSVRHFYPFNWNKKLYCSIIVSVKNIIRFFTKKNVNR